MSSRDEFALIAEIRARLGGPDPRVRLGIGDDAAVLSSLHAPVVTVDAAVEGVHFDRGWLAWSDIGWRSYVAAFSDLAAMNARAVAGLSALVLPRAMPDEDVLALVDGIAEAARAYDAPIVGGNIASGNELSITTTAIGDTEHVLARNGARIGDGIFVSGTVGAAALGWRLLARGRHDEPFVGRWRRPHARFDVARAVGALASAAIDVSDGLLADLGHLCEASGVGAAVELECVPLAAHHHAIAASLGEDGDTLACSGGEDYELLFTSPGSIDPAVAARIGTITAGPVIARRNGKIIELTARGHRHR